MISVADIKDFAIKAWNRGDALRGAAVGEPEFPLRLRFRKTGGQHAIDSFSEVQRWVSELNSSSKEALGYGFTVEFAEVNHRKLGRQSLPNDIRFDTPDDLARFIGRRKELVTFLAMLNATRDRIPQVASWMVENPIKALPHLSEWDKILDVCEFVQSRPRPGIYLRQISIPGVDTKFFEAKRSVLSEVLTGCLPEGAYDETVTGLARCGFERRFGFLYDEPIVRYRILDEALLSRLGYRDIGIPTSEFVSHDIPGCHTVFITENKVNGLAFPPFKGGVVIFGLGYGIGDIAGAAWLKEKRVIYWGDIDTHGYGILSLLRGKLPHVESILMSSRDIDQNRMIAVNEPNDTRRADALLNLTEDETKAYSRLLPGADCEGLRIEQERVPFVQLVEFLESLS
jgi:hypothetical protein